MTSGFDKLIGSSVPRVPDPGDVRRLNRRFLKQDLVKRGRLRQYRSACLIGSLAMVLILVGSVGDLGSDTFDVTSTEDFNGKMQQLGVSKILRLGERGQPVPQFDGRTEDQTRELATQAYNDEGQLIIIKGWRTATAESWTSGFTSEIGGESTIRSRGTRGMPKRLNREFITFLIQNDSIITNNPQQLLGTVSHLEDIQMEGAARTFRVWTFNSPGLGQVSYYLWEADY